MLEAERTRNDQLQQETSQLYAQLGFVQAKLQDAEEQIRLLMAPKDEAVPPSAQTQAGESARNVPRRAWWKLWG